MLTYDRLRELLHYDEATGIFTWRVSPRNRPIKPGDVAGTVDKLGYRLIKIDGMRYGAHRLAWLYTYGKWPNGIVDHSNRDPSDNSIANLRLADKTLNNMNSKTRSDNTSGVRGITRDRSRWRARIYINNRLHSLGSFRSKEDAAREYVKAARRLYGEFAPFD